jgi:hypothetical protein
LITLTLSVATTSVISESERRAALDAVTGSRTFDRSEQLKNFLRFVCEQEWQGKGDTLTEYAIGVHALGRASDFSPVEDSIVRNRAYALRKKLEEYYGHEGASDRIRIDLPKGSYIPQFLTVTPLATPQAVTYPQASRIAWWPVPLALILGAALMYFWQRDRLIPEPPAALRQLWGSLLDPSEEVILCVSTPPTGFLRNYPIENPPVAGVWPTDEKLRAWLYSQRPYGPEEIPHFIPNLNTPLWGDSAAATRVTRTLTRHGIRSELTAERLLKLPALRNRSVIFLGSSEYSSGITRLLQGLPLQLTYDRKAGDHIAIEQDASGNVVKRWPVERRRDALALTWGLLTFLPAEGDGQVRRRYLVISGVSSAGTLGAAEFATSEAHVSQLMAKTAGSTAGPNGVLQVLVRVAVDQTLPMHFEYADHRLR